MKLQLLLKKSVPLLASFFLFTPIYADSINADSTLPLNEHQGSYVEGNLGGNFYYLGILSGAQSIAADGFAGFGFSGAYGYQFHPGGWALEGGVMRNYIEATINSNEEDANGNKVPLDVNFHVNVPYLTARWEVPIGSRFDFISKVGMMFVDLPSQTVSSTQNGTTYTGSIDGGGVALPFVSLGAGYAVTPNISVVAQYQGLVIGILGAGLLGVGVDAHF